MAGVLLIAESGANQDATFGPFAFVEVTQDEVTGYKVEGDEGATDVFHAYVEGERWVIERWVDEQWVTQPTDRWPWVIERWTVMPEKGDEK